MLVPQQLMGKAKTWDPMKIILSLIFVLLTIGKCDQGDRDPTRKECAGNVLDNIYFTDTTKLVYQVFIHQIYNDTLAYSVEQLQLALDSNAVELKKDSIYFEIIGTRAGEYWIQHNVIDSSEQLPLRRITVSNFESFIDLNRRNALNVYLVDDKVDDFRGSAGLDIPTVNCAVQRQYMESSSLVHELLHCLGCLHTHEPDMTDGLNTVTGDKVCDTPSSPQLTADLTRFCDFNIPGLSKRRSKELVTNLMSYSSAICRKTITKGQAARIKKATELNPSIRKTLKRVTK